MRVRELQIAYRRRPDLPPVDGRKSLTCPTDVVDVLRAILEDEPVEVFAILCLTTLRHFLAYHELSRGTLDETCAHPRLCWAEHKRGYVAAVVMWRRRLKASGEAASRSTDAT